MTKLPKKIRPIPAFGRMALSKPQEKQLDTLWAKAVKAVAGNRCEYCARHENIWKLDAHHFYGRKNKRLRHVVSNGFALCFQHHRMAEEQPALFIEWAKQRRGVKWYDDLMAQAQEVKMFKEYSIVKAYLESFLKKEML